MGLTTDRNDPRLKEGQKAEGQNDVYLVLSEEERAKGFIRPVRTRYKHRGRFLGKYPIRALTDEEIDRHGKWGYVAFMEYPEEKSPITGTFLTQEMFDNLDEDGYVRACGTQTTMGMAFAETYAKDPNFYSSTFCCYCNKHLPVYEFVWDGTNEEVGS